MSARGSGAARRAGLLTRVLYGLLLRAYPAEFRRQYGEEARELFARLHVEAAARGALALLRFWGRTVVAVVRDGFAERVGAHAARRAVSSPATGVLTDRQGAAGWLDILRHQLRLAVRSLRRRPGFALTVCVLMALGIGAATTLFSVVDAVLLRPLPYPAPDRLYIVSRGGADMPIPDFHDVHDNAGSFDALGGVWADNAALTGEGEPERVKRARITGDLFAMLGAHAVRGRLLTTADEATGATPAVVISPSFWVRHWGGDPGVIGRTIRLDGSPYEVVGVLDPHFIPPAVLSLDNADVFAPLQPTPQQASDRRFYVLAVVARLRDGATPAQAGTQLNALAARLAEQFPDLRSRNANAKPFPMISLEKATAGDIGTVLWTLFGAVGLMLLIACANVANLFLARATDQQHELAVCAALGASRVRIVAQSLVQSALLGVLGGALGVLLALAGVHAFRGLHDIGIPRLAEVTIDLRILLFTLALSLATGVLFGLAPALLSARSRATDALRESNTRTTAARGRARLRIGLVVAELGLALILLTGASLLFHSFVRLGGVAIGFRPQHLLTVELNAEPQAMPRAQFVSALETRIATLPGVRAVGSSWMLPFSGGRCCWGSRIVAASSPGDTVRTNFDPITTGYMAALGAHLRRGRDFNAADEQSDRVGGPGEAPRAATLNVIVNDKLARRLWPDEDALGRVLRMTTSAPVEMHVIGVVDDIRHWGFQSDTEEHVYLPYNAVAQWSLASMLEIGIRHDGDQGPLLSALRSAVRDLDPELPLGRVRTMDARLSSSIATPRFYAMLLALFAALAFLLAAAGVYGSMLYVVGLRRRENGHPSGHRRAARRRRTTGSRAGHCGRAGRHTARSGWRARADPADAQSAVQRHRDGSGKLRGRGRTAGRCGPARLLSAGPTGRFGGSAGDAALGLTHT